MGKKKSQKKMMHGILVKVKSRKQSKKSSNRSADNNQVITVPNETPEQGCVLIVFF